MGFGFVYLMSNGAMPFVYKIGMTERAPHQRLAELSASTSAPVPFVLNCFIEVENARLVEAEMHAALADFRLNPSREFFAFHPGNMPDLLGAFKYHPAALTYAECDISEMYFQGKEILDPWGRAGEIRFPFAPVSLRQIKACI